MVENQPKYNILCFFLQNPVVIVLDFFYVDGHLAIENISELLGNAALLEEETE